MLAHHRFIGRPIDTIDLVSRDIAVDPLDLRTHLVQDATGFLRDCLQVGGGQLAGAWELALDEELRHGGTPLRVRSPRYRSIRGRVTGGFMRHIKRYSCG